MSARSLAELAVERDVRPVGEQTGSATEVLVAAIPSETLAAYTALVGIVLAADVGAGYGAFRWSAYVIFVVFAFLAPFAGYYRKVTSPESTPDADHRRFPVLECAAAALAAAAWGLVMPGSPLGIVLDGNALVFATAALVLGAATLLAFATQFLGKANDRNTAGVPVPTFVIDEPCRSRASARPGSPGNARTSADARRTSARSRGGLRRPHPLPRIPVTLSSASPPRLTPVRGRPGASPARG
ncbi:hypothetical protein [Micromonospora sp. ATA51]|uniref:hypothetical protein n=1 Tax=Micromonospora sp. ATA51 TaxID=2806098 RepID=UPI001A56EF64|nr:hypothetical protein [Micromonospora sp. ATA51]MBM0225490.1 hypothetical protein [Micromonospora sp. ATA51]